MNEFAAERKTEDFKVGDKTYQMREMDGTLRDQYNDLMIGRMDRGADGKLKGMKKLSGLDSDLLTRCVWDVEATRYVDPKTINSWPASTLEKLSKWALEFNGLDKKAEENAKNDSGENEGSGIE